ncbi:glutathione S-transferase C-terminal domain-containing protein [Jeongeupia naejangsanensis]|uniref:Glutathione S-transferase N-terminal domain-containing protein n=1 Tax=Jeongeupia naejangsanensis TaxID=613195 RepID=A0ABS2BHE7_9NEIS|nr:glutathione S-transferase C-terminal domain-containing protein [Jeongeupia naejangsanensis]MBM3115042.1 glutathione S-transferase N-terminal domain-containing protein [Jeongeupia naejangsanensis]
MITLYTFGPGLGLPDPSPFVTKTDVLLKLSGLPYRTQSGSIFSAPKGKLPHLDDDGHKVVDSTFIRAYLEDRYDLDFDEGYTPAQRALAWSVEKMLEEHLYFAVQALRWENDANFERGPAEFFRNVPAPMRAGFKAMIRRRVSRDLYGQGMGRHTADEQFELARRDIDATAELLGDKPYLLGDTICGTDATVFAFLLGTLCPRFESPLRRYTEQHKPLVAYVERMMERFYPDFTGCKKD